MSEPSECGDGWSRLRAAVRMRPRVTRAQLAVAVLCALFGFGLVVQVHSIRDEPRLSALRQTDLVRLLDDQSERSRRLRSEIAELEATRERLRTGTDRTRAALEEARRRAQVLGILAGTLPASGPGIVLTIDDPRGAVQSGHLLDAVQELRDAGAEVIEVGGQGGTVRVVVRTYFVDPGGASRARGTDGAAAGGVLVDGTPLRPPYRFVVIGDPATLAAALEIPGGVLDTLRGLGAAGHVDERTTVTISTLRPLDRPQYARPASPTGTAG